MQDFEFWIDFSALMRWSELTFKVDISLTKKNLILKFYCRCITTTYGTLHTFDFVEFIPGKSLLSWSMSLAFCGDCVEFDRWCVDVFLLWDMFRLDLCLGKKSSNDSILILPLAIWQEKLVRKLRLIARLRLDRMRAAYLTAVSDRLKAASHHLRSSNQPKLRVTPMLWSCQLVYVQWKIKCE